MYIHVLQHGRLKSYCILSYYHMEIMAEQETVKSSVQIKGIPGETSAVYGGIKRTRSNTSDTTEVLLPRTPQKRPKIEGTPEMLELFQVLSDIKLSNEPKPVDDKNPCEIDVEFMKKAYTVSMKSEDNSTKVGAIIINPETGDILGEGWNRMPAGCEAKFTWNKGNDILETKYPYVLHGVRAAIIDALKKKADLEGTTLYATLIPDHNDSQIIREVGITRVVFVEDKFHKYAFTVASKRILDVDGLEWRQIKMPDEKRSELAD